MRVLIAPDKFKGTLTAHEAAAAMARGWKRARPQDELVLLPISDGGDGFGEVFAEFINAKPVRTITVDAAGRRCVARWWWAASSRTAIVESARVIGLAMLSAGRFHPFEMDTRGLAQVLRAAAKRGARQCIVGIGGSATNDGGFGLATGLGWKFFNRRGDIIRNWTGLNELVRCEAPVKRNWPRRITVAVDVRNPLLGRQGSTRVYGPQKGVRADQFVRAEICLRQLAKVMRLKLGRNAAREPGAGAAGGLGFGLVAFAGAKLEPGFELVARTVKLDAQLRRADLVVTGEGSLDRSTWMGKGTGELAARCRAMGRPCVALGGQLSHRRTLAARFAFLGALTDLTSPELALADAGKWLEALSERAASDIVLTRGRIY